MCCLTVAPRCLQVLFVARFGSRASSEQARYAFNAEFAPLLRAQMAAFNASRPTPVATTDVGAGSLNGNGLSGASSGAAGTGGGPGATAADPRLDLVRKGIDDVKGVMRENIEKVLDRGASLDGLVVKTETLRLVRC